MTYGYVVKFKDCHSQNWFYCKFSLKRATVQFVENVSRSGIVEELKIFLGEQCTRNIADARIFKSKGAALIKTRELSRKYPSSRFLISKIGEVNS